MSKKVVDIVVVLDRSGSMFARVSDTVGAFNSFIEEQKKIKGKARVTLIQFNQKYTTVYDRKPIEEVDELTADNYNPTGNTALLDAVGYVLDEFKSRAKNVVVCILTDGKENASVKFKKNEIKQIVENKQEQGWLFLFAGVGIDAFHEAGNMGVLRAATSNVATSKGAFRNYSSAVADYRNN